MSSVLNTRERFVRTLTGRDTDRVPFIKVFGGDHAIVPAWEREHPGIGKTIDRLLQFEGVYRGWQIAPVNMGLSGLPQAKVLEDDQQKRIVQNGDGSVTVHQKTGDFHRSTKKWAVQGPNDWDRIRSKHMDPNDSTRFSPVWPARVEAFANRDYPLQLTHGGVYGFARNLMGDEALAFAFVDYPEMVHDIMNTYTDMCIAIWEKMVNAVSFDLIECWEDMAYNQGPMISPTLFTTFMKPVYQKIAGFADAHGIKILLVDSDGHIEKLTGWMLEAGVTALYPFEVQAVNDVFAMLDRHPFLGIIGGLDKNVMARSKADMDMEIEKARLLIKKGRMIPGPDHFVLSDVSYANYRYFMQKLREVILHTKPGIG